MNDQLQELLKRVYEEGVAKAQAEAEAILAGAKSKADSILEDAGKQAEAIVAEAQKKADELQKNSTSDIKLASQHSISTLKNKITDIILQSVYDKDVKAAFNDTEFIKKVIVEVLEGWKAGNSTGNLVISESLQSKLDDHFLGSIKAILGNKLNIEFSPQMKQGFTISPADGTYKLSFTEEDFINLFKSFVRPRTQALLFNS